jgi:hypothetical protein
MTHAPNTTATRRTKAGSTFNTRRIQQRLYVFIARAALLVVLSLALLRTAITHLSRLSTASSDRTTLSTQTRTGILVVVEVGTDRCRQQLIFSNDTGQLVAPNKPSDNSTTSTPIRHFDVIKKSFSNQ